MLQPAITVQAVRSLGFIEPAVPDGIGASRIADTTIRVSWDAARGATSYKVWQATSAGGPYSGAGTTSNLFLDDSGLANSTEYFYKVSAINAKGESDKSSETASATTAAAGGGGGGGGGGEDPATAPNAPSGTGVSTTGATTQTVTWTDNSSDEDGFNIYRDGVKVDSVGADVTSYNATGLTEGTSYAWKVSAFNANGESGFSSEVSATTQLAAPSNLGWSGDGHGFVTLAWDENSSKEAEVHLYKDGALFATLTADSEGYPTTEAGSYKVKVAHGSIPDSSFSNTVSVSAGDLDSGGTGGDRAFQ